jgi:hypothetical protein
MRAPPRLLIVLAAAWLAGCEPAPPREQLDPHALHVQLQQLASLASEAALLAQEIEAGHLNRAFAWVHQQGLSEEARRAVAALAQPAPAQLQAPQHDALLLAAALQIELSRVASSQRSPGELRALRERFDQLGKQAHALGPAT